MLLSTIFFGSSDYCLKVLQSLYDNFIIKAIITRPDKKIGRKQILTSSAPKQFGLAHNIKIFTPQDKNELLQLKTALDSLKPDIAVVADYGLFIPRQIFALPKYKTINIHFSRLPSLRGPSPVQYTILLGEKSAWISFFLLAEKMDSGDIIWQKEVPISENETTPTLYNRLFEIASLDLPNVLSLYIQKKLQPHAQNNSKATFTKIFDRNDGFIPFSIIKSAIDGKQPNLKEIHKWSLSKILNTKYITLNTSICIDRALRAFTPWPGVWTVIEDNRQKAKGNRRKRLKILKVHLESQSAISSRQSAMLIIDQVQLEGKKPISWKQFTKAYKI